VKAGDVLATIDAPRYSRSNSSPQAKATLASAKGKLRHRGNHPPTATAFLGEEAGPYRSSLRIRPVPTKQQRRRSWTPMKPNVNQLEAMEDYKNIVCPFRWHRHGTQYRPSARLIIAGSTAGSGAVRGLRFEPRSDIRPGAAGPIQPISPRALKATFDMPQFSRPANSMRPWSPRPIAINATSRQHAGRAAGRQFGR